jgi:hypothetical protein
VASLLAARNWDSSGALRVSAATLRLAGQALKTPSSQDAVLSVVRDAAQTRALSGRGGSEWAAKLAMADQAQQAGSASKALGYLKDVLS